MRGATARSPQVATAYGLTAVAGCVDAIAYTRISGVFPANQSGNLILLGLVTGGAPGTPVGRTAAAIAAFALGVMAAARSSGRLGRGRDPGLLAAELALLALAALLVGALPVDGAPSTVDGARGIAALVVLGLAMGVQTEVIGRVVGVGVSTTFETGALTRLAEQLGRPGATDTRVVLVLALGVATYVAGAAAGASIAAHWSLPLMVPVAALALLVAVHALRSRRTQPASADPD
ncbi:MAG: DUF1275 domain-containing protein [Acidimicrobiales bacterium]|nr:DUF1275 domain-containing protein [Acidimicrobiales bacterium]